MKTKQPEYPKLSHKEKMKQPLILMQAINSGSSFIKIIRPHKKKAGTVFSMGRHSSEHKYVVTDTGSIRRVD